MAAVFVTCRQRDLAPLWRRGQQRALVVWLRWDGRREKHIGMRGCARGCSICCRDWAHGRVVWRAEYIWLILFMKNLERSSGFQPVTARPLPPHRSAKSLSFRRTSTPTSQSDLTVAPVRPRALRLAAAAQPSFGRADARPGAEPSGEARASCEGAPRHGAANTTASNMPSDAL